MALPESDVCTYRVGWGSSSKRKWKRRQGRRRRGSPPRCTCRVIKYKRQVDLGLGGRLWRRDTIPWSGKGTRVGVVKRRKEKHKRREEGPVTNCELIVRKIAPAAVAEICLSIWVSAVRPTVRSPVFKASSLSKLNRTTNLFLQRSSLNLVAKPTHDADRRIAPPTKSLRNTEVGAADDKSWYRSSYTGIYVFDSWWRHRASQ